MFKAFSLKSLFIEIGIWKKIVTFQQYKPGLRIEHFNTHSKQDLPGTAKTFSRIVIISSALEKYLNIIVTILADTGESLFAFIILKIKWINRIIYD